MKYKYITANNLMDRQTYMYSDCNDPEFWTSYLESRNDFISNQAPTSASHICKNDDTFRKLEMLYKQIKSFGLSKDSKIAVNCFVKSFEVRKRIYSSYDSEQKPYENALYNNYDNYLLFAEILVITFQSTQNLKYLSCLLKLDDTLLSIVHFLDNTQIIQLKQIIQQELNFILQLMGELGFSGDRGDL